MKSPTYFKTSMEQLIMKQILLALYMTHEKRSESIRLMQQAIYGQVIDNRIDWELLYELIEMVYPSLHDSFTFSGVEKQIVYLSLFYVDLPEIALLTNYSFNTIRKRQTEIRKKLNIAKGITLTQFLQDKLQIYPQIR